jgi:predicted RNase H-like nuclease (RuvC/YqgF family)
LDAKLTESELKVKELFNKIEPLLARNTTLENQITAKDGEIQSLRDQLETWKAKLEESQAQHKDLAQ